MARFRDILKNKNFLFLWLGQIVANFGERLSQMALVALVYKRAPGSTIEMAKLIFFIVIPVFIIGPIAGVYVDRWDRKRIMIVSDILRGIFVLFIPVCILFFKNFIAVYVIVFIIFAIARFFFLSKMAIIPDLVPKEMLLIANTLSDTTRLIATFIGIGVAGVLVERIGAINGFYINSLTYFISALFLSNMVVKKIISHLKEDILIARDAFKKAIRKSVWTEIIDGIKYIVRHKELQFVMKNFFVLMAGSGAISCVIIVFIQDCFGSVTKDLSLLFMFLGFGAFLGAMTYGRFGQRLRKESLILTCMLASGFLIFLFSVTARYVPNLWLSYMLMLVLGFSIGPIIVSLNTAVHERIPQETRGRVFSSQECVINIGFLVFMFVSAYLAESIEKVWILASCGLLFLFWGTLGLLFDRKQFLKG
ncbi:MAG: MFS transporter [Candidatus Omnitrophica bacterium]|nr:MFS transporter [Candidatus Omnitrophota bacterium]